jgi:hypothetical protein
MAISTEVKQSRRKLLGQRVKSYKVSRAKTEEWKHKKQVAAQNDEPNDGLFETAGNADHDIDQLPDLLFE